MHRPRVKVVVYQQDDGYVAQCLNVNVASDGNTEAEALANIREALELYFEDDDRQDVEPVGHVRLTQLTVQGA